MTIVIIIEVIEEKKKKKQANRTTSAVSIAKVLKGIDFLTKKNNIIEHAKNNKDRIEDFDAVINTVNQISDRDYNSMANVEHEVGKIE